MKIILIGFMCSGKTTVSKLLGEKLKKEIIEMDNLIREMAKKTTDEIFHQEGETGYREYEIAVAKKIRNSNDAIISTGGGVVMNKIILDYLQPESTTIFLETSFEILVKRLENTFPRPLFDNREQAKDLFEFRLPLYKRYADFIIQTDAKTPEKIADEIIELVHKKYE